MISLSKIRIRNQSKKCGKEIEFQKETFDLHIIKLRDILEGLQKNVSKLCTALISHFPSLRTSASIETTWWHWSQMVKVLVRPWGRDIQSGFNIVVLDWCRWGRKGKELVMQGFMSTLHHLAPFFVQFRLVRFGFCPANQTKPTQTSQLARLGRKGGQWPFSHCLLYGYCVSHNTRANSHNSTAKRVLRKLFGSAKTISAFLPPAPGLSVP